jgi:hypothetical protein
MLEEDVTIAQKKLPLNECALRNVHSTNEAQTASKNRTYVRSTTIQI